IAHAGRNQELEVGQLLEDGTRKGGALAHGADDLEALQRLDDVLGPTEVLVEHLDVDVTRNLRPVGHLQGDVLEIVEDCAAVFGLVVVFLGRMTIRWSVSSDEAGGSHRKRETGRGRNGPPPACRGHSGSRVGLPSASQILMRACGLVPSGIRGLTIGKGQPSAWTRAGTSSASAVRSCLAGHLGPGPRL